MQPRLRILLVTLFALSGLCSCVGDLPVDNAQCPCADGWVCCLGENVCVPQGDACPQVCGNGYVEFPETCDNGDANNNNAGCTASCEQARCGDGFLYLGAEDCDDGEESALCNSDCTQPICGDGIVNTNAGESCDDSNTEAGDYCSADCLSITGRCGDGVVQANESCDAGDTPLEQCAYGQLSCDVCDTHCGWMAGATSYCGDGVIDFDFETCDDNNTSNVDACTAACVPAFCGDGILRTDLVLGELGYESCDDGSENSDTEPNACRAHCARPKCGDGVVDRVEQCDAEDSCAWPCGLQHMSMDASSGHTCANVAKTDFQLSSSSDVVVDTAPLCWGDNQSRETEAPVEEIFEAIVVGNGYSCGYPDFREILGVPCFTLGQSIGGNPITCWGNLFDNNIVNQDLSNTCDFANPIDGSSNTTVLGEALSAVSAGKVHLCGLVAQLSIEDTMNFGWRLLWRAKGDSVHCWGAGDQASSGPGEPHYGQSSPPEGLVGTAIAAGDYHSCSAFESDIALSCPCESGFACCEETSICVPEGSRCPSVDCWGLNDHGQATPPTDIVLKSISAGGLHTCGLTPEGQAICWGAGSDENEAVCPPDCGQSRPPTGTSFRMLDAGYLHTCGIQTNGQMLCWGAGQSDEGQGSTGQSVHRGQSMAPAHVEFLRVAAGKTHTCGIRAEFDILCWGSNDAGQLNAPDYWTWAESL